MNKRAVALAVCFFVGAIVLAYYGGGFSFRQILVAVLVLLMYEIGTNFWKAAFPKKKFTRIQFRIEINGLCRALADSGIYTDEYVQENRTAIFESLGPYSNGCVQFTWLEEDLFFMNGGSYFADNPEIEIEIAPAGSPDIVSQSDLKHRLEMQHSTSGYELVLVKSADRYRHIHPTPGLQLLQIPYKFLWALQGDQESQKRAHAILAALAGMKYWGSDDGPGLWGYTGRYVGFRWLPF